jgi:hypothetical protein
MKTIIILKDGIVMLGGPDSLLIQTLMFLVVKVAVMITWELLITLRY